MFQKADVEAPLCGKFNVGKFKHQEGQFWSPGNTASTAASTPASSPPVSPLLHVPRQRSSWSAWLCSWTRPRFAYHLSIDEPHMRKIDENEKRGYALPCAVAVALCVGVLIGGFGATWVKQAFEKPLEKTPYVIAAGPKEVPQAYLNSQPLNNSCLIPNLDIPMDSDHPQTFDACGFVIKSTDETWNLRGNVDEAVEKYFHEGYINAGSWGKRGIGKVELRDAILKEMTAFPDIKIHITDCVCRGNDVNGYKCAMPDVLEGTNTGPSGYGPATGKYARWTGMVQSIVKKNPKTDQWQYYAEWGVHDEWALIQQLGLDFDRVPHPPTNPEPFHDCQPLAQFTPEPTYIAFDNEAQEAHYAANKKNLRSKKELVTAR